MSAAPLISAAVDGAAYEGLRVSKKARLRDESTLGEETSEGACAHLTDSRLAHSSEFVSQVAVLREQFSSASEALVSSILESTGNKPEQARCLLSQILASNPRRSDRPWAKRRRSMSAAEDDDNLSTPPSPRAAVQPTHHHSPSPSTSSSVDGSYLVNQWLEAVMHRLEFARTQDDVIQRLRPAVEELLAYHQQTITKQQQASTQKVHKLLSRAILSQTEKIGNLESTAQTRTNQCHLLQHQLTQMQRKLDELEDLNRKLKRDNGWLHHYIRCQHSSSSPSDGGFHREIHGPDVY